MTDNRIPVLRLTGEPFTEPTENEKRHSDMMFSKYFDNIPSYNDGTHPTIEDIRTVEKVLKYTEQCKWISLTKKDVQTIMEVSTNILKWGLNLEDK